jgi:hypothetical protein
MKRYNVRKSLDPRFFKIIRHSHWQTICWQHMLIQYIYVWGYWMLPEKAETCTNLWIFYQNKLFRLKHSPV